MAYSSILGAERAPTQPSGRGSDLLGPSDNSDSGSDALGTEELHGDSDSFGTGERGAVSGEDAREGGDILPDRVVRMGGSDGLPGSGEGFSEAELDGQEFTDLDNGDADLDDDDDDDGADR